MRKYLLAFGIITIICIIFITISVSKITKKASASIEKRVVGLVSDKNIHDFGEVKIEESLEQEHIFVLKNTSKHPIKIIKQGSTCGCTTTKIPENTIVPVGAELKVPIKSDWRGKIGAQSAVVTLSTDDLKTPHVSLEVRAFIKVPAIISPTTINFGLLKAGQEETRVVKLLPGTDPKPFDLTAIENPSSNISISRLPDEPEQKAKGLLEGSIGEFAVKIKAPRTSGREETRIVFNTDLENRPEVLLIVQAQFEGAIVSVPKSIFFSDIDSNEVAFYDVCVQSNEKNKIFKPEIELSVDNGMEELFFIKNIETLNNSDKDSTIVTIGCNYKNGNQLINRASLKIISGSDLLEIPITAIGQK